MANKKFTLEEIAYLRGSEHVLDVTESCVYFSAVYKAASYEAGTLHRGLARLGIKWAYSRHPVFRSILGI